MGTTYSIKAYVPKWKSSDKITKKITHLLINHSNLFSTYSSTSEISKFNDNKTFDWFTIDPHFTYLMQLSYQLYEYSNQKWDPTIWPLFKLWGFHSEEYYQPTQKEIQLTLEKIGLNNIELTENKIKKKVKEVEIDLSSIAKGYAADRVSKLLSSEGSSSHFIEIGGEIITKGLKPNGSYWKAGIEEPTSNQSVRMIRHRIQLENKALATSGDYRRFFIQDNKKYSHLLNPKTGYPIETNILSVSVVSNTCALSDGLATILMIMPYEKGYKLIQALEETEALWIIQTPDHSMTSKKTDGFDRLLL